MSLIVLLRSCVNLRGTSDRLARITFRGVTYQSSIYENCSEAEWDEEYEWPLQSPLDPSEFIEVEVYNFNKIFNNRLVGVFRMVLQKLIQDGSLEIQESLVDSNNTVLKAQVLLDLQYHPPDRNVDTGWESENLPASIPIPLEPIEPTQPLINGDHADGANSVISYHSGFSRMTYEEQRQSHVNLQMSHRTSKTSQSMGNIPSNVNDWVTQDRNRKDSMPAMLQHKDSMQQEKLSVVGPFDKMWAEKGGSPRESISASEIKGHSHPRVRERKKISVKEQDYQVQVRVLECRQLAGTQLDPVATVTVGNQKKHTAVKEQTNCPYWDEFFVFDFKMPSSVLFDKIINLQVFTGRNLVSQGSLIGSFKLDVGTAYAQVDHRFCRRWAVLTDPEETLGASGAGVKGYLKVDITVLGKGDPIKETPAIKDNDEDIEGNLLLPEGVPAERPKAQIVVKIYRAEGLPKMNSGLMANVKKAFTGEVRDLADPYVEVSFAGHKQRTSVKKHTYEPAWNEQVVFAELFPPLCRRIRVQLKDSDSVSDEVIGTHFIDLSAISNDGANGWNGDLYRPVTSSKSHKKRKDIFRRKSTAQGASGDRQNTRADVVIFEEFEDTGFMPTFGPCWVNLYGSTRDYSLFDEHNDLNNGLGEGVSYRGRLLMAVQAETGESASDSGIKQVEVEPAPPISETAAGKDEQFQLFACLYEASMIDRKVGDKNIQFEMTIGNYGNQLDRTDKEGAKEVEENPFINSLSLPARPISNNRQYYHIPWEEAKPCLHVKFSWQDHRRRLYNANIIYKICERFEDGLVDIVERVKMDLPDTYKWLIRVLGELINGCTNYLNLMKSVPAAAHIGRTKLDQERLKLCNYEIEAVMQAASELKAICKDDQHTKENMKIANGLLQRLLNIATEPQDSLSDIFIWMLCGNKRVAYTRVPAQHVVYSLVEEERGKDSGRMQTLFLRLPGKRGEGPKGWAIQSKLNIMIWLGLHKHKKDYLKDAPKGYEPPRNAHKIMAPPPNDLVYKVKQKFVLRSHLYQARSLIGSDASGLSDAFAKVVFTHFIAETRVIWETRSPTWDQMIIFEDIYLWGDVNEIAVNPPTIVVEIFDKDIGGDSEFIGRALARPIVKMACEPYEKPFFPPALEWFQIFRGEEKAGELLAAFELLQVTDGQMFMPPEVEPVNTSDGPICPVPEGIRPVMKKHKIEVLFWGVREMKRLNLQTVDRPQVDIECAGRVIQSTVIANARRNPNFINPVDFFDVELPENERYCPPLTIRVRDCRTFGRFSLVGTHVLNSLHRYLYPRDDEPVEKAQIKEVKDETQAAADPTVVATQPGDVVVNIDEPTIGEDTPEKPDVQEPAEKKKKDKKEEEEEDDLEDTLDWWSRYYETMKYIEAELDDKKKKEKREKEKKEQEKEGEEKKKDKKDKKKEKTIQPDVSKTERKKNIPIIEIYRNELETVPLFNNFNDWLHSFSLYRGKKTSEEDDDEHRVVGKFKGSLKVWQYPLPENVETDPVIGTFRRLPSNEPVNVLVRVYVVKAINLHPSDPNGKADPYLVVTLGKQKVKDRDNYISKQLNPIFGRTFEFEALIPMDSILTVGVYDWDLVGSDDLIGETKIDLENRFYSKHRATCGLQEQFATFGFNKWRDPQRPAQILAKICKDEGLDGPHYNNGRVQVEGVTLRAPGQMLEESGNWKQSDEPAALMMLRNFDKVIRGHHLVPEHVETRCLFSPDKPGVEQGQIEMWVDMFHRDMQSPGAPVDITPRKPTSYELRIIVWNTDEVVMDDTNMITGEQCSDIFVKGWIEGMKEEKQETDVHYKSMTGEGNFNWRLIFPFDYQRAEERIIITRKASFFSWDESEEKVPPRIVLQVWDADAFSADDFIGDLSLDLNKMPRGAKSVKTCTLDMAKKDGSIPHISLFKLKHMRGWWPFTVNTDLEEIELAGKLEAEFELLTEEEAEKKPAGRGREEPEPLPKPNRPDTSFVWFMNPLKSLRYMLWNNYKMCIVKFLVIFLLLALMGLFFYSMPGYTVKKIFNA